MLRTKNFEEVELVVPGRVLKNYDSEEVSDRSPLFRETHSGRMKPYLRYDLGYGYGDVYLYEVLYMKRRGLTTYQLRGHELRLKEGNLQILDHGQGFLVTNSELKKIERFYFNG